jgi:leukotriene-A4 hydrolase
MTTEIMTKIDADYNCTNTADPEVKQRWFPLGIKMNYTEVTPKAKEFVQGMGRWKYVKPIYQALLDSN